MTTTPSRRDLRGTAWLLIVSTGCAFAALTHHPTTESHHHAGFVEEVHRESFLNAAVHGGVVLCAVAWCAALLGVAHVLGATRTSVRLAMWLYGGGAWCMSAAALNGGFILPSWTARFVDAPAETLPSMAQGARLLGTVQHECATWGVVGMSLGVLFWSLALMRGGRLGRTPGLVGFAAAAIPLVGLSTGWLGMTVGGMLAFAGAQGAWNLTVGWSLLRTR